MRSSRFNHEIYPADLSCIVGDVLYASALGNNILVMNKLKDAEEIFDRRSKIYSDRQEIPLIKMCVPFGSKISTSRSCVDLHFLFRMGWDRNIGLNQYGDKWRIHRKICQQNFNQRAAAVYHPIIKSKVQELLQGLLRNPENFEEHTKKYLYP